MTVFKVQTYLTAVSNYDSVMSFAPDYVYTVAKVRRRWWLPWPRIEIGVIKNLRAAETGAVKRAIAHAHVLRRKVKARTRILRVVRLDGKESKSIIWENGKILDVTLLPWYRRFLHRLLTM